MPTGLKTLAVSAALFAISLASTAQSQPVPGPDTRVKVTEDYARLVARDAFLWAWPMVNVYNRRLTFKDLPQAGLMGGIVPVGPPNRLAMLTDYIQPEERLVACPNQDVVYGFALLALDQSPVVIQVPNFGDRFWVYQIVDLRTDSFADLGKMYGSKPGFYLLAGPNWNGKVPRGITKVFRAKTNTGVVIPRVFQDDAPEDKKAVQSVIDSIDLYPLAEFDGKMKRRDWSKQPNFPSQSQGEAETKWVPPEKIFDILPAALKDAPPLPGEAARYEQVLAVIDAANKDTNLRKAMADEASKADTNLVGPMFEFHNWGIQLPNRWSTVDNGAAFGTDYFTRTAVAKSNIFVNKANETKYFYQDLDATGGRLNGANRYTVTFAKGQLPPVRGFWSLTLYNQHHFFNPNELKRYSVGTKNKTLKTNPDGSLTVYVQSDPPSDDQRANWLPSPKDSDFSLYVRSYWPEAAITSGKWTPPAVVRSN
ncbi:MAG: DUF1254 domain-containing protein [Pseudolabrys sp.]